MASNNLVSSSYAAAHTYHTSIPQASHALLVPPPTLGDRKAKAFPLAPPANHEFEEGEFVSPGFFAKVDPAWFSHQSLGGTWAYAMRREAQQILPFLYLGPSAASKDKEFLKNEGITLLLSVRDKRSALARLMSGAKVAQDMGIQSDSIDIDSEWDLISHLPQAIRRINEHVVSGASAQPGMPPKVLLFCEAGNEKSATVAMAYLMAMFNLDMPNAMWSVQHRRFCINVDETVQNMLTSFETILDAKRQVTKARQAETSAVSPDTARLFPETQAMRIQRKRSFIDRDDVSRVDANGDMDIDGGNATEDNSEHIKQKPAPFIDRVS